MKAHLIAAAMVAGGISASSSAAIIATEPFDYNTGQLAPNPAVNNGGSGWAGPWTPSTSAAQNAYSVVAPGLSIGGFSGISYTASSSGNATANSITAGSVVARTLSTTPAVANNTYWFSILVKLAGNSGDQATRVKFLTTGTSSINGLGFTLRTTGGENPTTQLWAAIAGAGPAQTGPTIAHGVTHLIVGKLTTSALGNEQIDLWAFADGAAVDMTVFDGVGQATVLGNQATFGNVIILRSDTVASGTVTFDELRLGETLADVGVEAAIIPEPASVALLGAVGMGLAGRRRRQA